MDIWGLFTVLLLIGMAVCLWRELPTGFIKFVCFVLAATAGAIDGGMRGTEKGVIAAILTVLIFYLLFRFADLMTKDEGNFDCPRKNKKTDA